ncbi:hypothetical protein B0H12DRAFT_1074104 [Mycena haematopus]|nr:hypothetical protein B0H12DRAFT_1074104 [Mycena haematopus]
MASRVDRSRSSSPNMECQVGERWQTGKGRPIAPVIFLHHAPNIEVAGGIRIDCAVELLALRVIVQYDSVIQYWLKSWESRDESFVPVRLSRRKASGSAAFSAMLLHVALLLALPEKFPFPRTRGAIQSGVVAFGCWRTGGLGLLHCEPDEFADPDTSKETPLPPFHRNFALDITGAKVIYPMTSATPGLTTWCQMRLWWTGGEADCDHEFILPTEIIRAGRAIEGECWTFEGTTGQVTIRLREAIKISNITIELFPLIDIKQSPRHISLWGLAARETFDPDQHTVVKPAYFHKNSFPLPPDVHPHDSFVLLAQFEYKLSTQSLRFQSHERSFPVSHPSVLPDIRVITLDVRSNWGSESTCLSRPHKLITRLQSGEAAPPSRLAGARLECIAEHSHTEPDLAVASAIGRLNAVDPRGSALYFRIWRQDPSNNSFLRSVLTDNLAKSKFGGDMKCQGHNLVENLYGHQETRQPPLGDPSKHPPSVSVEVRVPAPPVRVVHKPALDQEQPVQDRRKRFGLR